jgi:FkbM family methyltransferase
MGYMHRIKEWVEARMGVHIYRSTLPWGSDLHADLRGSGLWPEQTVVFDVGAHLGQTAVAFLKNNPAALIHCFEPAPANYTHLQKVLFEWKNTALWKLALSSRAGTALLHLKEASSTHSLVNSNGSKEAEEVEVQTLDAFCNLHDIDKIHFLKIDTEGADLEVLKGAEEMLGQNKIDFIQVETSTRKDVDGFIPFHEVEIFMGGHGYELFGFYDQQPCWSGRQSLLYLNAVYVRVSLIASRPVDGSSQD